MLQEFRSALMHITAIDYSMVLFTRSGHDVHHALCINGPATDCVTGRHNGEDWRVQFTYKS